MIRRLVLLFSLLCAVVSVSFLAIAMILGFYAIIGGSVDNFYEWLIDIRPVMPTLKPVGIGQILNTAAQSIINALLTWYAVGVTIVVLYALDTYRRYRARREYHENNQGKQADPTLPKL